MSSTVSVTPAQFDSLKGFFAAYWCHNENTRKKKPSQFDFAGWAELLDAKDISWSVQNTVAGLAEVRNNGFLYFKPLLERNGIVVAG